MSNLRLAIIIPTLNERNNLPETLAAATGADEYIVADGGSTDGTREWVQSQPRLNLLDAPRGRGPQLAMGAAAASTDILLFLHADCRLPGNALNQIRAALADTSVVGGCFSVRFAETQLRSLMMTAHAINLHSRLTHTATGDQAIFVRYSAYQTLGGFAPWPLFEDVEFVDRLRRVGRFVVLRDAVTISARRWLTFGVGRTNLLMLALWIGYRLGVPPATLKRWFADVRPNSSARKP